MPALTHKNNYRSFYHGSEFVARVLQGHYSVVLIIALDSLIWMPALFSGELLLHGDSFHGLAMLDLLGQALEGNTNLLWQPGIYGGHPLFAESQGAFLNPLNLITAWLFDSVRGIVFFHWASGLIASLGIYFLARTLGLSCWSSTFAGVTALFSSSWLQVHHNLTMSAAVAWVPWFMAAVEAWLKKPQFMRAGLMAVSVVLLIFAGYPQITYGVILYVAVSLIPLGLSRSSRDFLKSNYKQFLLTGFAAILIAAGFAAVQLLPLAELVTHSHRADGVSLLYGGLLSPVDYFKGILYSYVGEEPGTGSPANVSSISVVLLAAIAVILRPSVRILGHIVGTTLLLNLGMEMASPLFRAVYNNELLPGLHSFRIMHPFFTVSVAGFALISAYSLDRLTKLRIPPLNVIRTTRLGLSALGLVLILTSVTLIGVAAYVPAFSKLNFVTSAVLGVCLLVLLITRKQRWFGLWAVLIFSVVGVFWKSNFAKFHSASYSRTPAFLNTVLDDPMLQDYRVYEDSVCSVAPVFSHAMAPEVGPYYRRALKCLNAFTSFTRGIRSIQGNTALQLNRWQMLEPIFRKELSGDRISPPGTRAIDILGIKYISRLQATQRPGMTKIAKDVQDGVILYRNEWARPRFQFYSNVRFVESADQAVEELAAATSKVLILERQNNVTPSAAFQSESTMVDSTHNAVVNVLEATEVSYVMNVETDEPGWLFLSDANYPGWTATVNGQNRTIYSAQVLGKALFLEPGKNVVSMSYKPSSFYLGLGISLVMGTVFVTMSIHRLVVSGKLRCSSTGPHHHTKI